MNTIEVSNCEDIFHNKKPPAAKVAQVEVKIIFSVFLSLRFSFKFTKICAVKNTKKTLIDVASASPTCEKCSTKINK